MNQERGFTFIPFIVVTALVLLGGYGYFLLQPKTEIEKVPVQSPVVEISEEQPQDDESTPVAPVAPVAPTIPVVKQEEAKPQITIKPAVPEVKPTRPVLSNIGINIGVYDPATGMAGDILFTKAIGDHYYNKAFLEFGAELTGPAGTDIMPHPTYFLPRKTKIISPVNGIVENIRHQPESNDYEIVIIPDGFSGWRISFDHIINVSVEKKSVLRIGDVIAEVAQSNSPAIPSELGWVELQIWQESTSFFRHSIGAAVCPFMLLDENIKQDIASKITRLADDWEKFLGKDVYQQEKWVFPGCLFETAQP